MNSPIISLRLSSVVTSHHSLYWPQHSEPSRLWEGAPYFLALSKDWFAFLNNFNMFPFKMSVWRVFLLCHLLCLPHTLEVRIWHCEMGFVECKFDEYEKQEICIIVVHSLLKFPFVWAQSPYQCMEHLINEPQL